MIIIISLGQLRDWDLDGVENQDGGRLITQRIVFGRSYQTAGHYFTGSLDNFLMWTELLSDAQMDTVYRAGKRVPLSISATIPSFCYDAQWVNMHHKTLANELVRRYDVQ